jgi:Protein of unknown function (DUF3617)
MHTGKPAFLPMAGLAAALLALPSANAADMPMRKSGLWEIQTETDASGGRKMPGPMTMQICIDQKRDDLTAQSAKGMEKDARKRCSKMDMKRTGKTMVIDSVCTVGQHTTTGHTVISGNLASEYRMENTTRFDPPMHGMQTTSSVATGKWLGPCKPGQTHGSVSFSGMPGMPGMGAGGDFQIDPEMMRKMRQMQEQYGR